MVTSLSNVFSFYFLFLFFYFYFSGGVDVGNHFCFSVIQMVSYDAVAIFMVIRALLCEVT